MKRFSDPRAFFDEAGKGDTRVKFNGRTLRVSCTLPEGEDRYVAGDRLRAAVAGPGLRMVFGRAARSEPVVEMFVNTDEDVAAVLDRVRALRPSPAGVEGAVVDLAAATRLWAALHRSIDGGD